MNDRIKELLKQATIAVDPFDREWVFSRVDQAKFAELIVRECALQCNHNDDMDRILEYFGVEE